MSHIPALEVCCLVLPAVMIVGFLIHACRAHSQLEFRIQLLEVLSAAVRQRLPLAPLLEQSALDLPKRRRRTVLNVAAALREGAALDEALAAEAARYFPEHVTQAIRTGAGTARLATMLDLLAGDLGRTMSARHRLVMALLYPAVVGGLLVFVASDWLATKLHPSLNDVESGNLPDWSMPLALVVWATVTLLLLLHALSTHENRRRPDLAGKILSALLPPLRRARRLLHGERLLRGMAILIQAGVPLPRAMRACAPSLGDARAEQQTLDAAWNMECGQPAELALARTPLPAFAAVRAAAAVRADPQTVAERLRALAAECASRGRAIHDRTIGLVNPVALALVGLALAGLFRDLFLYQGLWLEAARPW